MGADVDDGAREALVRHARHGDEELPVEIRGFDAVRRKLRAHILKSALPGRPADHRIVDGRPEEKRIREAPQGGVSSMAFMFRAASAAFFLILSLAPIAAQSLQPSASVQGFHSRARLIAGGTQGDAWLAGIEITLDRASRPIGAIRANPGCRRGSTGPARRMWPAPRCAGPLRSRHEDAGGVANVYGEEGGASRSWSRPRIRRSRSSWPFRRIRRLQGHLHPGPRRPEPRLTGDGPGRSTIEAALAKVPARAGARRPGRPVGPRASSPSKQDKPAYPVRDPRAFGREAGAFRRRAGELVSLDLAPGRCRTASPSPWRRSPKDASGPFPCA